MPSRPHLILAIASLLVWCGCASTAAPGDAADAAKPQGAPKARLERPSEGALGTMRVIAKIQWSEPLGQYLIGVDPDQRHAFLHLEGRQPQRRFAIDTISLETGRRVERWEASVEHAARLVNAYPRFRTISGSFSEDLARYASFIRRAGPWSGREGASLLGVSASPNGRYAIYGTSPDGDRDGDWLMLTALPDAQSTRRLDDGLRASYRPNFSPDSSRVAWIGGSPKFAQGGQHVGYVLHVAELGGRPEALPEVRDVMGAPLWTPDSQTLHVVATMEGLTRCVLRVDVKTRQSRELMCHEGSIDMIASPDGARLLLLLQHPAQAEAAPRQLVLLDPERPDPVATHEVVAPMGMGPFGQFVRHDRVALFTHGGQRVLLMNPEDGVVEQEVSLPEGETFTGRHTTQVAGDELILLRQSEAGGALVGIKVR